MVEFRQGHRAAVSGASHLWRDQHSQVSQCPKTTVSGQQI